MFFLQDQYRVTSKLTLNYGLRLESPHFAQPRTPNPDYRQTGIISQPGLNAAPRFAFAYAPFGPKTVFRGGYGMFYARTPGGVIKHGCYRDNSNFQYTLFLQGNNAGDLDVGPVFPNQIPTPDRRPPAGSTSLTFAGENWRTPYTQQADFGIEQQIQKDTLLTVSYIWSRGLAFTTIRDANAGPLGPAVSYRVTTLLRTRWELT